jgi:hypothetical protein
MIMTDGREASMTSMDSKREETSKLSIYVLP